MYIGSTSQSVFHRESNRMSVAKKLSAGGEGQAELAIRFWVSKAVRFVSTDFNLPKVPHTERRGYWNIV